VIDPPRPPRIHHSALPLCPSPIFSYSYKLPPSLSPKIASLFSSAYKCPLPQPLSFHILTNARGCRGSACIFSALRRSHLPIFRQFFPSCFQTLAHSSKFRIPQLLCLPLLRKLPGVYQQLPFWNSSLATTSQSPPRSPRRRPFRRKLGHARA